MADTVEYFSTKLPQKFENDADFRESIQNIFGFKLMVQEPGTLFQNRVWLKETMMILLVL